jgi:hypothetical protein
MTAADVLATNGTQRPGGRGDPAGEGVRRAIFDGLTVNGRARPRETVDQMFQWLKRPRPR